MVTKKDIDNIISVICPNDEDFEKACISPAYLKKELEALALEQEPCEDCISREAAIRACCGMSRFTGIDEAPYEYVEDVLRELPSVKPKVDVEVLINKIETELSWSMYDDWGNTTDLHDGLVDIIREWVEVAS